MTNLKTCECELFKLNVFPCDTAFYCICGREFEAVDILPRFWKDYQELHEKVQKLEKLVGKLQTGLCNEFGRDEFVACD